MPLVPPGAVGLKFWSPVSVDKRTRNAWNVEDTSARITLSNLDRTATSLGTQGVRSTRTWPNETAGKLYAEFVINVVTSTSYVGLSPRSTANPAGFTNSVAVSLFNGAIQISGSNTGFTVGAAVSAADIVCIAWDAGA